MNKPDALGAETREGSGSGVEPDDIGVVLREKSDKDFTGTGKESAEDAGKFRQNGCKGHELMDVSDAWQISLNAIAATIL